MKTRSPNGYNLTDGGDGNNGIIFSEEARRKMSINMIGNSRSKGLKKSKKILMELSKKFSGKNNPMYGSKRFGILNPRYNKKTSKASSKYFGVSLYKSVNKIKIDY